MTLKNEKKKWKRFDDDIWDFLKKCYFFNKFWIDAVEHKNKKHEIMTKAIFKNFDEDNKKWNLD